MKLKEKKKLSENKRKYFDQLKSMAVKREKDFNKVKSDEMLRALEKKKAARIHKNGSICRKA